MLDSLLTKEDISKAREEPALLKSSIQSYIKRSVENDKSKDTAAELDRFEEHKPRRLIQRNDLCKSRAQRNERAKKSAQIILNNASTWNDPIFWFLFIYENSFISIFSPFYEWFGELFLCRTSYLVFFFPSHIKWQQQQCIWQAYLVNFYKNLGLAVFWYSNIISSPDSAALRRLLIWPKRFITSLFIVWDRL